MLTFLQSSMADFTIGQTSNAASNFKGLIDEVRISASKLARSDVWVIPEPSALRRGSSACFDAGLRQTWLVRG